MKKDLTGGPRQVVELEWVPFSGGNLEARRPQALCAPCAAKRRRGTRAGLLAGAARSRNAPLCFECFRTGLERERALMSARDIHTASEARFRYLLPFEPVNHERLERIRAERTKAFSAMETALGRLKPRRRKAQITARRALGEAMASFSGPRWDGRVAASQTGGRASAVRVEELQFPESWLPFVVAR